MLNEVKHLANVSCQVTARDPSDATLCQDDTQRGEKASLDNSYIIAPPFCQGTLRDCLNGDLKVSRFARNDTRRFGQYLYYYIGFCFLHRFKNSLGPKKMLKNMYEKIIPKDFVKVM